MLYLIGTGLNEKGISLEGLETITKCNKVYLEGYTVDFPYTIEKLEKVIGKKLVKLGRNEVESDILLKEAKKQDVALLIYGSPLFATTHMSLVLEAKKQKLKIKIIYSSSIFDAISETGLQLYKFGKISSMPMWQKNFEPKSFLDIAIENSSIKAHSLILIDIGLSFEKAIEQLEKSLENKENVINIEKILVCSKIGNSKSAIFYGSIMDLKSISKQISSPYCLIIPGEQHFLEKEAIERFSIKKTNQL